MRGKLTFENMRIVLLSEKQSELVSCENAHMCVINVFCEMGEKHIYFFK